MSSEVGSGHVSIFPVMTGFKSRVTRGTKDAGAAGSKTFDRSFKGTGTKTGRALGRDMKSALSSTAGDLGAAQMTKLTGKVASASAALAKVRLKQQDDAGRVRVAELRLQEAIERSGEGSSQAAAAEERLASVRRTQQATTDAVTAATARLRAAQEALSVAQHDVTGSAARASGGVRQMLANFRSGFTDARAAQSAFTGLAGSIGGIFRAASDLTGLTYLARMAREAARQVASTFTSLATMVGGQLARAWSATSRWVSSVASTVATALAPIGRAALNAGRTLATPFMQLGSRVATWMRPVTTQVSAAFSKVVAVAGPAASRLVSNFRSGLAAIGPAASNAFRSITTAASNAASAAGTALANGIRGAATGAVTVAAAGIGVALGKGFSRLTAIDTARAKLTGLGNDATAVETIMGDALASVKGTAFGLGEAATVAAAAVAAQIKPGEQLQGHLKNIANNASAAGISMEEMGSIFNRAATQANGVQNDVISQLADRGIPIYQALADQMGVTAGEVFKMASEGKVDFETFSKAAEAAAGTVAKEIGQTVPGAARNFLASMGRIGANALEPIYGKIGPLISAATSALGPIEERAKALGGVLLNVLGPAMDWLTNLFNRIGEGASLASVGLGGIASIVAPLGAAFAALGAGGLAGVLARLGPLSALIPGLTGALSLLGGPLGIAAAAMGAFALSGGDVSGLVSGLTGIISQVVGALPGMVSQLATFVPQIVTSIVSQIPALLGAAVQIVNALVQGLVTAIPAIATGALALVQGLITAIVGALPMIIAGAIQLVMALIQGIVTAIPLLITAAVQLVTGLLTAIVSALPMIIEGGIQLLLALVMGIVSALPTLLTAALDLVMGLLDAIISNLPMIIEAGIQLLLSLVTGLINALPKLITTAINLVVQLVVGLLTMLPKLIEAGIQLVVSLIVGLVQAIPKIIAMLPQIIEAIWNGLTQVDWADLGVQIVQGIINGLGSMVGAVVDAISNVASAAFDGFKDFFGIASPSRLMRRTAPDVVRGAALGIEDEAPTFTDAVTGMAKDAAAKAQTAMGTVSTTITAAVTRTRAGDVGTAGPERSSERRNGADGDTYNLYGLTTRETAEQLSSAMEKKKRRRVARTGALREAEVR